jgi:nucleotide-binding universal stress UspA family protein
MTRVLIAVDGTSADQRVVAQAHGVFGDDAHYVLLNVRRDPILISAMTVGVGMSTMVPGPEVLDSVSPDVGDVTLQDEADAAAAVATAAATAGELHDAEAVGEVGLEPDVILTTAAEHQVDVIVVGNHDRNWFSKLLSPSVSETVAERSPVPVLVIRHADH